MICPLVWVGCQSLLLLCYCQFLLLCLLVFVLCIEVLLCWVHGYLQLLYLPLGLILRSLCSVLPYLLKSYFKVYFVWYEDCYSSFLLLPICMEYIFPSSQFQYLCLGLKWVSCRQHIYGFCFISIQPVCVYWLEHLIYLHLK